MLTAILMLVGGLVLLLAGADRLVAGVSALAASFGVPPLVIAMTVVAFGTSTPEIVVNVVSARHGETGLAFGNIVGACTINVGFVLALTAVIRPLTVEPSIITRDVPMMLLAVAAVFVLAHDRAVGDGPADVLNHADGLMLLLLFAMFVYMSVFQAIARRKTDAFIAEAAEMPAPRVHRRWVDVAQTLAGIAAVAIGGRLTVHGAVSIAESLGVPDVVIGLTLVSFGTTAPELATCLVAARRGQSDIVIGNVVGSNIVNILLVGGLVAAIHPMPVPPGGGVDLLFMTIMCIMLLPVAIRGPRRITRTEGAVLLVLYLSYVGYRGYHALTAGAGG
jgi:cation:H+ antiporter